MPARPWFAFYPGDYLADTAHLTLEQHGAYLKLMMYAYTHGGRVPNNPRVIGRILGIPTKSTHKLLDVVTHFWQQDGGDLVHTRIDRELAKSHQIQKVRKESGRKGGIAKATNLLKQNPSIPQPHTTEEEDQEPLPPSAAPVDNSKGNGQSPSLWDVARRELGGSYLGKLLGEFGEKAVEDAIVATLKKRPAEWKSYLTSILRKPRRGKSMDQLALEGGYTNEAK